MFNPKGTQHLTSQNGILCIWWPSERPQVLPMAHPGPCSLLCRRPICSNRPHGRHQGRSLPWPGTPNPACPRPRLEDSRIGFSSTPASGGNPVARMAYQPLPAAGDLPVLALVAANRPCVALVCVPSSRSSAESPLAVSLKERLLWCRGQP